MSVSSGRTHYVMNFIVAEILDVDVIVGTTFISDHVVSRKFLEQWVHFRHDTIPILGSGNRRNDSRRSGLWFKEKAGKYAHEDQIGYAVQKVATNDG